MKGKPVKVLLVEDNPGDARLVREALAEASTPKFQLTHVDRLDDGLARLNAEEYDVVVLDLLLEDSPRLGSLMEIYEQGAKVPIVVYTGLEDETVGLWALKEGAEDYLVKGRVDGDGLVHSICQAIDRHQRRTMQTFV